VVIVTHDPLSQTKLVPQEVPFVTSVSWSAQAEASLAQEVSPLWQALAGVQGRFAVHAETHVPAAQTRSVPHDVPSAASFDPVQTPV
jgi:hypothetical protein